MWNWKFDCGSWNGEFNLKSNICNMKSEIGNPEEAGRTIRNSSFHIAHYGPESASNSIFQYR